MRVPLEIATWPSMLRGAVGVACAAALIGCQAKRDPNVLVLVIDALRPDHLGCYGYPRATSPALDALAKRGILFTDATSASTYTRASVASIFASVYPSAHGVLSQGKQVEVLSDRNTQRAELYRLSTDPAEKNDLIDLETGKARGLVRLLQAFDQDNESRRHWRKGQEGLPGNVVEGLRSLGYVQ